MLALVDIVALIAFLLALASPLRHQLMTLVFDNNQQYQIPQPLPQAQIDVNFNVEEGCSWWYCYWSTRCWTDPSSSSSSRSSTGCWWVNKRTIPCMRKSSSCGDSTRRFGVIGFHFITDDICYCYLWVTQYRYPRIASALTATNHRRKWWVVASHEPVFLFVVGYVCIFCLHGCIVCNSFPTTSCERKVSCAKSTQSRYTWIV